MSITGRQNNLFLAEDWKVIYQTFQNVDFTSYDFENLRRMMITSLRENFPEDFNDYIESSEYLALIDLIAFLGQSLAFRMDLNARENFLELAERRESVIRLAQLLSYNAKRNVCASGLLRIDSVSTTEDVIDSTGRNLSNLEVSWNDVTNTNWFDQFIKIMNAAMISELEFGYPEAYDTINGTYTEQYRFNSSISNLTLFSFSKPVDSVPLQFEVVSTVIKDSSLQEDPPMVGNKLAMAYRDDGTGYGSINTGWFMHFRQGTTQKLDFVINNPVANQIVNLNDTSINDSDIWLYSLSNIGNETQMWTKVPAITGTNIIYNSIDKTIKNIYSAQTIANDSVNLVFADGVFGNLPKGSFRCYYRTSNGTTYIINPKDLRGIIITVPYISRSGSNEEIKFVASLKSSITNSSASETNAEIKKRAPATYYTQNRMITGEDYNLAPLNISQNIAKVKTINRTSSGISRNFDLIDASGKYSSTSAFCTDGVLYREELENNFDFTFTSKSEIESVIKNSVEPLTKLSFMRDFYYEKYNKIIVDDTVTYFHQATNGYNESTGYLKDSNGLPLKVSSYTLSYRKYFEPGSLVKIVPPDGYFFAENNTLTTTSSAKTKDRIWAYVVSVVGDGTASGAGTLTTGIGPIVLSQIVPTGSIIKQIIPKFLGYLATDVQSLMIDFIFNYRNFGLRYDKNSRTWQIIQDRNLNLTSAWSVGRAGNNDGKQLDSSWLIAFETDGEKYTVTYRGLEYYFESIIENRFFYDGSRKIYDTMTGLLQKDKVSVLKFNTYPNSSASLLKDYDWEIVGTTVEEDGYTSSKVVKITFYDSNNDGIVDNPEQFDLIVDPSLTNANRFVFFEKYVTDEYTEDYRYVSNENNKFIILSDENQIGNLLAYTDGQLFYFYNEDVVKQLDIQTTAKLVTNKDYYANIGRNDIYFYYLHNADSTTRIDPSSTNIMDIYLLTKDYDAQYRKWLKGDITDEPLPPSSTDLRLTYGTNLDKIKSISDDVVYHPVRYKVLFGKKAESRLQATFKVVKNLEQVITDNDIKSRIIRAINEFFSIDNFDFGDTFFFSELSAYVMSKLTPYITTFVIVPTNDTQVFGSLQQINSTANELFISGALVTDIEIIQALTAARLKTAGYIVTTSVTDVNTTNIKSSTIS